MAELLLELLCEDIPARMQARAAEDLKRLVTDRLKAAGFKIDEFNRADSYVTPRRLVLVADGLPPAQPDAREERKGPRVGAPQQAIDGFLKSAGLKSLDQCEKREINGNEYYFAIQLIAGRPTSRVLVDVLQEAIDELPWPKSMRWRDTMVRWIRPLHNILAVFDGETINLDYDLIRKPEVVENPTPETTLTGSAATVGHRFMAPGGITVADFADYEAKLRAAKVMLDPAERRQTILDAAGALAAAAGLTLKIDAGLLEEVVGMVEWPVVLIGSIDESFMDLPEEVLVAELRHNQKYFPLLDGDGRLAAKFVLAADIEADDKGAAIVAGNERVLRARLSDARFFWDHDRMRTLESRKPELEGVVFHAKLGSVAEKAARMAALAEALCQHIPGADPALARRAAELSKCDLVSGMVGEFPELQGVMGRYYALHDGEKAEVAQAIADHYAPRGPSDTCPSTPVSVAVALADKIDTLAGFFAIDEKPTGSKDPFALRRAALGVIRLIVENGLRVPLNGIFRKAEFFYAEMESGFSGRLDVDDLLSFFADRLNVHLRERGVRHDLIAAVFAVERPGGGHEDDLVRLLSRVEALKGFLESEDGGNLLTAFRRAGNIVAIEEKRDKKTYGGAVREELLDAAEEKTLYECLAEVRKAAGKASGEEDFQAAMAEMARLRGPVDVFFDEVTVNCGDPERRANRLRLLSRIRATLSAVADFSKIEG